MLSDTLESKSGSPREMRAPSIETLPSGKLLKHAASMESLHSRPLGSSNSATLLRTAKSSLSNSSSSTASRLSLVRQSHERGLRSNPWTLDDQSLPYAEGSDVPKFLVDRYTHHSQVYKFDAFFQESVTESAKESVRSRVVEILYYKEDDSILVREPRVENSGMPQGTFLKRHRVPKPDGSFVTINDLRIGADIDFYGRVFRIFDCDEKTRSELGLGPPSDGPGVPVTTGGEYNRESDACYNARMSDMKLYMEATHGRSVGATRKLSSFLKGDQKVLSFKAVREWEGGEGGIDFYTVNYFLADGTVEVLEDLTMSRGKDGFPALLRRTKLPLNFLEDIRTSLVRDPEVDVLNKVSGRYVTDKHMRIGNVVDVYGKKLLLIDCDEFTRRYTGDMAPPIEKARATRELPKYTPPEHLGGVATFGSKEDSLGSCVALRPQKPKPDTTKLKYFGTQLRFAATIEGDDSGRKYTITFYLVDDSVAIFEPRIRNSGYIAGKFLERRRLINPDTGKYFAPHDFYVGATLKINSFAFKVYAIDQASLNFMMARPNEFPDTQTDLIGTLKKLQSRLREKSLSDAFLRLDSDRSGHLTTSEFQEYLTALGYTVPSNDAAMIMFVFDSNGDGRISFEEFTAFMETEPSNWDSVLNPRAVALYRKAAEAADSAEKLKSDIRTVLSTFAQAFESRRHHLTSVFRKFDKDHSGVLEIAEFRKAVQFAGCLPEREIDILVDYFFPGGTRVINYAAFMKRLWKV